ncbi:MAG: molybdopterin molybdotransferase MoeA [Gammaproteobacteria bacterium]|nr:molybdopterin molybdotransferase MoeA [Gammaproteobacteria bacterium]
MNRCDTSPLLAYHEALEQLTSSVAAHGKVIDKPLLQAQAAVLAESIESEIDVPGCAMSSMDGYAINTADLAADGETSLPLSQRIAAGAAGETLASGTAARIFTGAPIPDGADAVIMQEQVSADDDGIRFDSRPTSGNNIRPAGNDIQRGNLILRKGCRLRAQDIGLAASVGLQTLPVYEPLKVGMFFTGDELVEPGQKLGAGKIYDSNRYTLHGLLESMGCEIIDLGLVGDTLAATREAMQRASTQADLVVTTGGVSVGEEDHVRIAIEQLGELRLWRLAIKPGKPLAYGQINETAFIGLPGNPVSVFATFCLFVCPVIQIMQGRDWQQPIALPVSADFDWPKPDSRREFLRARLALDANGRTVAQIYPNQDSGVLTSTVWADGFVEIAENQTVQAGESVNYLSFAQFFS